MIIIISLWNCFNGYALNSSRHELQEKALNVLDD